jgi:1-acyl-sn-glycerol-3-phosphate acyltransferase
MIRTALVLAFLAPYAAIACPLALLFSKLTGSSRPLYLFSYWGFRGAFRLAGIRITTENLERLGDARNTVIVSNHASHLDAPALFLALRVRFVALAKREVFDIPLFAAVIRRAGFIPINRGDRTEAVGAVARMVAALREGACVLVFPEGTRSSTGALGPFRKGAFLAAVEARSRVLPVVVHGTLSLMPRHGYALHPGHVRVSILDPVDAGRYGDSDRDLVIARVRSQIDQALVGAGGDPGGERSVA